MPSLPGEHARVLGNLEHRQIQRFLPDDAQVRFARILHAADEHVRSRDRPEAERRRQRGFAFEYEDGSLPTRPAHLADAGVPAGATTIPAFPAAPLMRPMEESTTGHEPGSSPIT